MTSVFGSSIPLFPSDLYPNIISISLYYSDFLRRFHLNIEFEIKLNALHLCAHKDANEHVKKKQDSDKSFTVPFDQRELVGQPCDYRLGATKL